MSYLLDTCVVSEFAARQPSEKVIEWLSGLDPESAFISVVTVGEIQKGIDKLSPSKRKDALREWLKDDLLVRFRDRMLPLEIGEMLTWGTLISRIEAKGEPMPLIDSLIAATALHHELVLVTRDEGRRPSGFAGSCAPGRSGCQGGAWRCPCAPQGGDPSKDGGRPDRVPV